MPRHARGARVILYDINHALAEAQEAGGRESIFWAVPQVSAVLASKRSLLHSFPTLHSLFYYCNMMHVPSGFTTLLAGLLLGVSSVNAGFSASSATNIAVYWGMEAWVLTDYC